MIDLLKCSVIQGSKMNKLLYFIYVYVEISKLQNLIKEKEWIKAKLNIVMPEFDEVENKVVNLIEDSKSLISMSNTNIANKYPEIYLGF